MLATIVHRLYHQGRTRGSRVRFGELGTGLIIEAGTKKPSAPVRRDGRWELLVRTRRQPIGGTGAVGGLAVQVRDARAVRREDDPLAVGRPQRQSIEARTEGQAPQRLPREIPDPGVVALLIVMPNSRRVPSGDMRGAP